MGFLSGLFGGGGSSSSSATTNTSQTGDSGAEAAIGSSGDQIALSNIGSGVDLQVNERPIDLAQVESLLSSVTGNSVNVAKAAAESVISATQPVADVARSASASETEAGRLIGKLAVPALIIGGVYLVTQRKK